MVGSPTTSARLRSPPPPVGSVRADTLNVSEHPAAANACDSLGEVYLADDDWKLATEAYTKSLALDAKNENARQQLDQFKRESKQKHGRASKGDTSR